MFTKRVHIVPVGEAVGRMVSPVVEMSADLVYLLADEGRATGARAGAVAERLGSDGVETVIEPVDQGTVYAVLGLVTTLADRHVDDSVRVNVSTGSRLATIGAALACMDDDTEAEAYHVPMDDGTAVADRRGGAPGVPAHGPRRRGRARHAGGARLVDQRDRVGVTTAGSHCEAF